MTTLSIRKFPWTLNTSLLSGAEGYEVVDGNGDLVFDDNEFSGQSPSSQDAAFIVEACNGYLSLSEQLQDLLDQRREWREQLKTLSTKEKIKD